MLLMVVVTVGSFAVTLVLASTGFFESQRSATPGGKGKGERGKGEGAPFINVVIRLIMVQTSPYAPYAPVTSRILMYLFNLTIQV